MAIAFVLFSILTGGLTAAYGALMMELGVMGTVLAYWLGGMAGTCTLISWVALRPDTTDGFEAATVRA